MQNLTVMYYMSEMGGVPTEKFIKKLKVEDRTKVKEVIAKVQTNGKDYLEHCSKSMEHSPGLFELRISGNRIKLRLFYYYSEESSILITHGIIKRKGPVPETEKRKAEGYYAEWCSNKISKTPDISSQ